MSTKQPSSKAKQPTAKAQVKIQDIQPQKDARGGVRKKKTADPCEGGE